MRNNPKFWAVVIICILVLLIILIKCGGNAIPSNSTIISPDDTIMKVKINKDGSKTYEIGVIEALKAKHLLEINAKDSAMRFLQQQVNRYKTELSHGGNITTFSTNTTFTGTSTTSVSAFQPIIEGDSVKLYPTYEARSKDSTWIQWSVKSTKDSTNVLFKSKDKYSVLVGTERQGLFKRRTFVEVTTYNPYNSVKSMRAFEVKDKRSTFAISVQAGYGITLHGLSPYIGIGVSKTLITF